MAKFNIELEIGWLDEGENLDEVIKEQLISEISNRVTSKIENEIEINAIQQVTSKITESIDEKVNSITEKLMNKNITIHDKWGDVVKKDVNIMDMFKEKMDNFLTEKVNDSGETTGYNRNKTRLEYIINKNISYDMERKVQYAAEEVGKKLKAYVDTKLKQEIGEEVAKVIGLDKITSKMCK